jgi:hypothetical protein
MKMMMDPQELDRIEQAAKEGFDMPPERVLELVREIRLLQGDLSIIVRHTAGKTLGDLAAEWRELADKGIYGSSGLRRAARDMEDVLSRRQAGESS